MNVHLNPFELWLAGMVGSKRQIEAIRQNLPDRHGYDGDGWSIHTEGAAGEMAFAKAVGLYWNGSVNTFKREGDVVGYEVRTRSRHNYELIIRPNDPDDRIYVLVTGRSPDFRVVGWIRGRDGKRPEWLRTYGNRPAAHFVPHGALKPLEALPIRRN